jgi:hypothetical protein
MLRLAISFVVAAAVLAILFLRLDVQDGVYAMAPAKVNEVIDRTDLPALVFADRAFNAKHWRVDEHVSMWSVLGQGGEELLRLRAATSADGAGARVHVDALPPASALKDIVAKGIQENGVEIDMLTTALAEQIDANLNGREFDLKRIAPAIARVMVVALPHLREGIDNANKESDRRDQDIVDRAYANEK